MKVICEICGETIATTTKERLSFPLTGLMFDSPDEKHGFPVPWPHNENWEDMRCGYCRFRPFKRKDQILTDDGVVTEEEINGRKNVYCPVCGREFLTLEGVAKHMKVHKNV